LAVNSVQDFKISIPVTKPALQNSTPAQNSVGEKHDDNCVTYIAGTALGGGVGALVAGIKKDSKVNLRFANFAKNEIKRIMVSDEAPKIFEELGTIEPSEYLPTYKSVAKNNLRLKKHLIEHPEDSIVQESQKRIEGYLKVFEQQINKIKADFKHLNKAASTKRCVKYTSVSMLIGLVASGMLKRVFQSNKHKNTSK